MVNGPDIKFAFLDRLDNVATQHQVLHVRLRNDHPLSVSASLDSADIEEAFNLLVNAADRLSFTELIHRACDGDILSDRLIRKRRHYGTQFGHGGAITIDTTVRLLEGDMGGEGDLGGLTQQGRQVGR